MHPQIIQDGPGKCPLCGMTLVPLAKRGGRAAHQAHVSGIADFKTILCCFSADHTNHVVIEMIQHWLNIHISFPGSKYVLLILSSIVFFYGGWPF